MQEISSLFHEKDVFASKKTQCTSKIGFIIYFIVDIFIDIAFVIAMMKLFSKIKR